MQFGRLVLWGNGVLALACGVHALLNPPAYDDNTIMVAMLFAPVLALVLLELTRFRIPWLVLVGAIAALPMGIGFPVMGIVGLAEILDGASILSWAVSVVGVILSPWAFVLLTQRAARMWQVDTMLFGLRIALALICLFALIHFAIVLDEPFLENSWGFFGILAASPYAAWVLLETAPRAVWVRWVAAVMLVPATIFFLGWVAGGDLVLELLLFATPLLLLMAAITGILMHAFMLRRAD